MYNLKGLRLRLPLKWNLKVFLRSFLSVMMRSAVLVDTPSLTVKATLSENATDGKVQLTEEERQRVLDEVERQQTEFGIEK